MSKFCTAIILTILLSSGARLASPQPARTAAPPRSPEVNSDRTVTFRLAAPKAAEVFLP